MSVMKSEFWYYTKTNHRDTKKSPAVRAWGNLHPSILHTAGPRPAGAQCVCFEVSCHAERMMKRPSARWNTSAAPFSHALCLFKVTSEKGICIGKRNSECKERRGPRLCPPEPGGQGGEKLVSYVRTCRTDVITHKIPSLSACRVEAAGRGCRI